MRIHSHTEVPRFETLPQVSAFLSILLCAYTFGCLSTATAEPVQKLRLESGWNAVFFHVTPENPEPGAVFADTAVDVVATFFPAVSTVQFIQDPAEKPWQKEGWAVWYAPGRPEASLSNLNTVLGDQPYLIHTTTATDLEIAGKIAQHAPRWSPNSYNLVGFPLDDTNPPSFAAFFDGSDAHDLARIYRLRDGIWTRVTDPDTTVMASNEAFWIYCRGRSAHQGPVALVGANPAGLEFGAATDTLTLLLVNVSSVAHNVIAELIPSDALPLATVKSDPENLATHYVDLDNGDTLVSLDPASTRRCRIHLRRERMTAAPEQTAALKLTTTAGTVIWVPVKGEG